MGALIYRLSRSEQRWFKNSFIRIFAYVFKVDTSEADRPVPDGYRHFNDFFTRELRPGARPVDPNSDSFVAPADGTLAWFGIATGTELLQAKGMRYSLEQLLGDETQAKLLQDAAYGTIYLAPYNYHRLHMPMDGILASTRFIPGLLYSVNARTTAGVHELYALNERLVCNFKGEYGPFSLVMVGAMNVASMTTAWSGEIRPAPDGQSVHASFDRGRATELARGDYLGHFNMGSTIIFIGPPGALRWEPAVANGQTIRMGERIGRLQKPAE
jgi:phosphatidylserine decarboxylase